MRFGVTVLASLIWLSAAHTQTTVPPPPEIPAAGSYKLERDGRHLFVTCAGRGGPTVIMEAGYGDSSAVWHGLQQELATSTRVCSYDRAGLGYSDPVQTRDVHAVLGDLGAVIADTANGVPVILVGHSIGGLLVNMYAYQHPAEVAGLVLVDSSHPDQVPRLRQPLPKAWLAARDGFFADAPAFETWSSDAATSQGETPFMQADSLGDLPLLVLTRDVNVIDEDGIEWIRANIWPAYSRGVDQLYGRVWLELQREYVRLSRRSRQVIVAGSTHYVQHDSLELTSDAVLQVVSEAQLREQGRLARSR